MSAARKPVVEPSRNVELLIELLGALRDEPGAVSTLPGAHEPVMVQELIGLLTSHRERIDIESSGPRALPDRNERRGMEARRQLRQRLRVVQDYRIALVRFAVRRFGARADDYIVAADALLDREQEQAINDYLRGYVDELLRQQQRQLRGVVNMASLIGLAGATADEILGVLAAEVQELHPGARMYFHEVDAAGTLAPRRNPEGPLGNDAKLGSCFCECERADACPAVSRRGAGLAPYIVDDARISGCPAARPDEEVGSYMCVRAIAGGKTFGVMTVASHQVCAFGDDDVRAFVALANQAALALQRNRLREELETYAQRLEEMVYERTEELEAKNEALTELTQRLGAFNEAFASLDTFLDTSAGLEAACRVLIERFGAAQVQVWLRDEDEGLRLAHEQGAIEGLALAPGELVLDKRTVARVAARADALVVNDLRAEPRLSHREALADAGVHSFVGLPLIGEGDELQGVLCLLSHAPVPEETAQILRVFAHQLSVLLHDAEIYRETSEQRDRIRALNDKLARVNGDLEDFTYVVSHDLKEPLRGIEAFSRFLAEDYADALDKEGKDYLSSLQRLAVRMKQLIDDLLTLSRIGRADTQRMDVDLDEIVAEVRERLAVQLDEHKVDLRIDGRLGKVRAERVRMTQLFQNLIGNAVKFNDKADPVIRVGRDERRDEDGMVRLYVRDNGVGIAPEHHEKVFNIFQRLHRREDIEGTGAGLTIVRKIVNTHGGEIVVESQPGEGATFRFTLPKA